MLIEIARKVRLTLWNEDVQMFHIGEIYEVPPAVGKVFVSDGWAVEVIAERRAMERARNAAHNNPGDSSTES